MSLNETVYEAGNQAIYWAVHAAVGLQVDVTPNLYWIVDRAMYWFTYGPVFQSVNRALNRAVFEEPPHPGLMLYLEVVT